MSDKKSIAIFAFDICEISQIRRIQMIEKSGFDVMSFSMRRKNMNEGFVPYWPNVHLFQTVNNHLLKRMVIVIFSCFKMISNLDTLSKNDMMIARNFDMLLIAMFCKLSIKLKMRKSIPLVYECLDIHQIFTRKGLFGGIARWGERQILSRVKSIIISSPDFERAYFRKIQGVKNEFILVENKLVCDPKTLPRGPIKKLGTPIKIGLVGTIRCDKSVKLLLDLLGQYPQKYEAHFYGIVHENNFFNFEKSIEESQGAFAHGAYQYPNDLRKIYADLDFVWAQDLWQMKGNSRWLLPNRIYEAGYFGCPLIALDKTATGNRILELGIGDVILAPNPKALHLVLSEFCEENYFNLRAKLLTTKIQNFVSDSRDLAPVFSDLWCVR